ncbi:hypothetical protein BARRETLEMON_55 [Arthrobacter phage BarretLemon]|uniref:Uncharacterized protein n=2 Tax=Marthavirus barretlemon TaxID=2560300 RepID=A0A386KMD4_9CAUD|nr:hypothetical protein BJD79_gp55 [Arthrobacter phage BarretLemon]AMM44517.1 hypothetical protein BARRETLEMON_55 [Arthrobacter phage BarretLemon]AYD86526.1 hypothetical protein SEA_LEEROYJ_55 [Arthrobacter phage LeeroyJ]
MKFEIAKFDREEYSSDGLGQTARYQDAVSKEMIAYIDYSEDGTQASVSLFAPGTTMRGTARYDLRDAKRAEGIVARHLAKQGYNETEQELEAPLDNEIVERAHAAAHKLRKRFKGDTGIESITAAVDYLGVIKISVVTNLGSFDQLFDGGAFVRTAELVREAERRISNVWGKLIDEEIKRGDAEYVAKWGHDKTTTHVKDEPAETLPIFCPRCGINKLDRVQPAFNARSRYAPVYICSPCGTHEALSPGGLDLWHDAQHALEALQRQQEKSATPPKVVINDIGLPPNVAAAYVATQWPDDARVITASYSQPRGVRSDGMVVD